LDRSAGSEAVLRTVAELARAEGARVRLVHVAQPLGPVIVGGSAVAYADQTVAWIEQEVPEYLQKVAVSLSGIEVEMAVRFGDPVEEILREAKSVGFDLIAMATHRRSGVSRLLKGSVAEQVERHWAPRAPCQVRRPAGCLRGQG